MVKVLKKQNIIKFLLLILFISLVLINSTSAQRELLYPGVRDNDVRLVQRRLASWGYYNGKIDGIYGDETMRAVIDFQVRNNLRTDGVVGAETWRALGYNYKRRRANTAYAASVSRNQEIEMLARLIHAEARAEPYEGQVAVAAVLLNRVESASFPNSISGVIYQPLAFESVANGQFNLAPNNENRRAARAALNGWDPTYGAKFFWNPSKPVNKWIWSRKVIRTIGDHIFAY